MNIPCPICASQTVFVGIQRGTLDERDYKLMNCRVCHYSFVENYRSDIESIYNEDYYQGRGADPLVDYLYELQNPERTVRNYEWEGIYKIFRSYFPDAGRWLDFGCGGGGLVRYARKRGADIVGVEDGWAASQARLAGIPVLHLNDLHQYSETFDFISAIEVLEHVPQPMDVLRTIRKLLKPGGVFFLTTGNAKPWRSNLLKWSYTQCPDVHVSFFEPHTLSVCFKKTGFESKEIASFVGFVEIIKFKVLKTLRIKNRSRVLDLLPWGLITKVVDARYQVSRHPLGIAVRHE